MKRYVRAVAWALVALLGMLTVGILVPAAPAMAANLGSAPDGSGNDAQCNVNKIQNPAGSTTWDVTAFCNYGLPSGATLPSDIEILYNTGGATFAQPFPTTSVCPTPDHTSNGICINTGSQTLKAAMTVGFGSTNLNITGIKIVYTTGPSGYQQANLVSVNSAAGLPSQPADWYNGGSGPAASDAVKGTGWPCSRQLDNTSTMTGAFTNGAATQNAANVTLTQAVWAWGDSSSNTTITGAGPVYSANHTFPALSTMPSGGWTTTITVTYSANSGHVFGDGSSSQTSTCSLRVDFLNPNQSAPGSSDSGSTGDTNLDACVPKGWALLNPLNLIGGVGCMLKVLFIPTSATSTALTHMWDGITTKAPFSVLYEVVTFIPDNLSDFVASVNAFSPIVNSNPNRSPICDATGGFNSQTGLCGSGGGAVYPFQATNGGAWGTFGVNQITHQPANDNVNMVRQISLFLLGVLFFYACYRGVGEILK